MWDIIKQRGTEKWYHVLGITTQMFLHIPRLVPRKAEGPGCGPTWDRQGCWWVRRVATQWRTKGP